MFYGVFLKRLTRSGFDFVEFELQNALEFASVFVESRILAIVGLAILKHQVQVLVDGAKVGVLAVL